MYKNANIKKIYIHFVSNELNLNLSKNQLFDMKWSEKLSFPLSSCHSNVKQHVMEKEEHKIGTEVLTALN